MSRRVRIHHVITRLIVGGAQEAAVLACGRVDRDRFDATLVTGPQIGTEGSLRPMADTLGVPTVVVPELVRELAPGKDLRAQRALRQLFRAQRPDIVHTHSSKAGLLGRWAAHREQVPVVVHTVHGWSFHDHMQRAVRAAYVRLERRAAHWCDHIVTVSDLDRDKGLAAGIGKPDQYTTIPELNNLAPYEARAGERSRARRDLGLPVQGAVVGTVGRFVEQKDPSTWLRAAARIARRRLDTRFVMIGDGPLRAETERAAADLGLADRLVTPGLRDDVPALLPALDVFLLTSRWEGSPLVIPQAMASGVAVVASGADGNRELVRHRETGLLVPVHDPESTAAAVLELLADDDLRARLAVAAREQARDFGLDRTIPRLEALYRDERSTSRRGRTRRRSHCPTT